MVVGSGNAERKRGGELGSLRAEISQHEKGQESGGTGRTRSFELVQFPGG